jgi:hypothetical protein
MCIPDCNNTFLIFLPDKYFNKKKYWCWYKKARIHIVEELENKGICVISNQKMLNYTKDLSFTFNEKANPKVNTLYIHLLNGQYYSDDIFCKKKIEIEREILFLLAAKLGVHMIEYDVETTEVTVSNITASTDIKNVNISTVYNKTITNKTTKKYEEEYSNRGAPVYIASKNIEQVEENIKQKFSSLPKVFSYDFYQKSNKLKTFVYKRYNFKMKSLKYIAETEDVIDKSFEVKSTLLGYGIGIKFDKYINYIEKVTYNIKFFTDQEIRIKLDSVLRLKTDPFSIIRERYNNMDDKDIAIFHIADYVRKYAQKCTFTLLDSNDRNIVINNNLNLYDKLVSWIDSQNSGLFEGICHTFISTYQIRTWLLAKLKLNNNEILNENDSSKIEECGILCLQKKKYEKYKKSLLETSDDSLETLEEPVPVLVAQYQEDSNISDYIQESL